MTDGTFPAQEVQDSPTCLNDDKPATSWAPQLEYTNIPANEDGSIGTSDMSHHQHNDHGLDFQRKDESKAENVNGHSDPPSGISIMHKAEDHKPLSTDTDLSTFFAAGLVKFSPLRGLLIQQTPNASTKSPLLILESKIQNAIQQLSLQSLHNAISILPFVSDLTKPEIQQIDNQTLIDIVHLVAQAMFQGSRIGGYTLVLVNAPLTNPHKLNYTHIPACSALFQSPKKFSFGGVIQPARIVTGSTCPFGPQYFNNGFRITTLQSICSIGVSYVTSLSFARRRSTLAQLCIAGSFPQSSSSLSRELRFPRWSSLGI
jgi:hypothetical protein